jgi:hypothetical protein
VSQGDEALPHLHGSLREEEDAQAAQGMCVVAMRAFRSIDPSIDALLLLLDMFFLSVLN